MGGELLIVFIYIDCFEIGDHMLNTQQFFFVQLTTSLFLDVLPITVDLIGAKSGLMFCLNCEC